MWYFCGIESTPDKILVEEIKVVSTQTKSKPIHFSQKNPQICHDMYVGKNFSLLNVYIAKAFKQTSIYKKNVRAKKLIWKDEQL